MMHVLAMTIFLGALALSMAVIFWMLSANRAKILSALLGEHVVASEVSAAFPAYVPRDRFGVTFRGFRRDSAPVMQRLAA